MGPNIVLLVPTIHQDRITGNFQRTVSEYDVMNVATTIASRLDFKAKRALKGTVFHYDVVDATCLTTQRYPMSFTNHTVPHMNVACVRLQHNVVVTSANVAVVDVDESSTDADAVGVVRMNCTCISF